MNAGLLLRRGAVFVACFGTGMSIVVWCAGGLHAPRPETPPAPLPRPSVTASDVVAVDRTSSLGPGRDGRLDRDDVAIVGGRAVPYRALTATWATSEPVASRDPGVRVVRLGGAQIVFFPRPSVVGAAAVADASAVGATSVSGREAILRQRENAPASAHLNGACVASHRVSPDDELTLLSESMDVRAEERGPEKATVHVLETEDPVTIRGGGSELTGDGMIAELGTGRDATHHRSVRIRRNVRGTLRAGGTGRREQSDVRIACDGAAEVTAQDRPGRDGRQPWLATFHDAVRFEDDRATTTADDAQIAFVRTGSVDRDAGAAPTKIRSVTATGDVRIDSRDGEAAYHVECEKLRRFAQDDLTEVTVLDGAPLLRWQGRAQGAPAGTPLSTYEVRCTGPATMRSRRLSAAKDADALVTVVFEGDVVATERREGEDGLRSEIRAPRLTVESRRAADGRLDPQLFRAEQGAQARFQDVAVRGRTISATAPAKPGDPRHVAVVGEPAVSWALPEGTNPLGGREPAGRLVLTAGSRIDVDLAPDPPAGAVPAGTRITARTQGGMVARKHVGEDESWRLTANDGDAKIGWDGALEEMHANGEARLRGRGTGAEARTAELSGDRMSVTRRAGAAPGSDALQQVDVLVETTGPAPAVALLGDAADPARRHAVRARELRYGDDGRVVLAKGAARADLHRSEGDPGVSVEADEIRVDLDRDGPEAGARTTTRVVTATGAVILRDAVHTLTGTRAVYRPLTGEAEATGAPARIVRREDPTFPSYAAGKTVRAWFDPKKAGGDRFVRATFPQGGEIVGYQAAPARQRVTTTCRGPLELTRATASCVDQVVVVYESRRTDGSWVQDARIDCRRLDMTLDPTVEKGRASEKIRTVVAQGPAHDPAIVRARSGTGDREIYAAAERIEADQGRTKIRLSCPSGDSTVYIHDIGRGKHSRCESVTFDYVTYEWTDWVRFREVE